MEEIIAYKLSNGELIADKDEAIAREKYISFEKAISTLIGETEYYSDEKSILHNFIIEHREDLKDILKDL